MTSAPHLTFAGELRRSLGAAGIVGLLIGLPLAVVVARVKGGAFLLAELRTRVLLWAIHGAPFRYVSFLECATERLFLRQVGRGYIFAHSLLRDYFASLQLDAAEQDLRALLEEQSRLKGPDDPAALKTALELAHRLERVGRSWAAEELYRQVVDARIRSLGESHPDTLQAEAELALCLEAMLKWTAASSVCQHILSVQQRTLGPEHERSLDTAWRIAQLSEREGNLGAAEELYRRIFAAKNRIMGAKHRQTLDALSHLIAAIGPRDPAEAYRLRRELAGRFLSSVSTPALELRTLALECYRSGDPNSAEELLRRLSERGFELCSTHCHLVRVLLVLGRDEDARRELEAARGHLEGSPSYMLPRIVYFDLVFSILEGRYYQEHETQLRGLVGKRGLAMEWDLDRLLESLQARMKSKELALLRELSAAISQGVDDASQPNWKTYQNSASA